MAKTNVNKTNTLTGTYSAAEANADATLEVQVQQEQKQLKAKMRTEQKVAIIIPPDPLNPGMKYVPVIVNGLRTDVPIGKMVQVPQTVAAVLADSDYISPKLTVKEFDESKMP